MLLRQRDTGKGNMAVKQIKTDRTKTSKYHRAGNDGGF